MTNIIDWYDGRMQPSAHGFASALAYGFSIGFTSPFVSALAYGFSFAFGKAKSVYLHSFLVKIRT